MTRPKSFYARVEDQWYSFNAVPDDPMNTYALDVCWAVLSWHQAELRPKDPTPVTVDPLAVATAEGLRNEYPRQLIPRYASKKLDNPPTGE